jgi:hypothetical protein
MAQLLISSVNANTAAKDYNGDTPWHIASWSYLPVVMALLSGGVNILAANNHGRLLIHGAVIGGKSEVAKYLLQHFYATTRHLPLHKLLEDLTWIGNPNSGGIDVPPLHYALAFAEFAEGRVHEDTPREIDRVLLRHTLTVVGNCEIRIFFDENKVGHSTMIYVME